MSTSLYLTIRLCYFHLHWELVTAYSVKIFWAPDKTQPHHIASKVHFRAKEYMMVWRKSWCLKRWDEPVVQQRTTRCGRITYSPRAMSLRALHCVDAHCCSMFLWDRHSGLRPAWSCKEKYYKAYIAHNKKITLPTWTGTSAVHWHLLNSHSSFIALWKEHTEIQ